MEEGDGGEGEERRERAVVISGQEKRGDGEGDEEVRGSCGFLDLGKGGWGLE